MRKGAVHGPKCSQVRSEVPMIRCEVRWTIVGCAVSCLRGALWLPLRLPYVGGMTRASAALLLLVCPVVVVFRSALLLFLAPIHDGAGHGGCHCAQPCNIFVCKVWKFQPEHVIPLCLVVLGTEALHSGHKICHSGAGYQADCRSFAVRDDSLSQRCWERPAADQIRQTRC